MIVGAFDLASVTGFAIGSAGGDPVYGAHRLPRTYRDYGAFGDAYAVWLRGIIQEHKIDLVVYETPVLPTKTNIETLRKLYSLGTVTEMVVRRLNASRSEGASVIDVLETDMQTVRAHFIGVTRAPKSIVAKERRAWMKRRIIDQCRARGWSPEDDNAADALSILDFALCRMNGRHAAETAGPLLTRGS